MQMKENIFTDEDIEKFKKATHWCICEKELPKNSTNVDHIGNIQDWLKTLGMPRCIPKYKDVAKKKNNFIHIKDEDFKKAKEDLIKYLKENINAVVRDRCHYTGKYRGAAHQYCNLQFSKSCEIPCFFP